MVYILVSLWLLNSNKIFNLGVILIIMDCVIDDANVSKIGINEYA